MTTKISKYRREIVFNLLGGKCYYCGEQLDSYYNFDVDHFIARKLGGTNNPNNLVPSCIYCNTVKGGRTIEEFRERIIYLINKHKRHRCLYLKYNFKEDQPIKFYFERQNGKV